ncbi:VWA domain-containing protein [Streptomyces sp. NPDC047017]|uniref:VWA domain-containing protein n=1 Tax=Streptomyces sp. NPDC047017 TaxID=3155024 RepID=UPI0033D1FA88
MGILTRLRNAFGRSRKGRAAEAEGADQVPAQAPSPAAAPQPEPEAQVPSPSPEPTPEPPATEPPATESPAPETPAAAHVPDPRSAPREEQEEHDLVTAAFDNVTVPRPAQPTDPVTPPEPEPEPETPTAETPEPEPEPKPKPKPEPEQEPKQEPEPEAEPEPTDPPQAADAPEPPQAAPAPDHASRTGGAGGNEPPAEGEAEAEPAPTPLPQAPREAEAEPARPATPLTRVKSRAAALAPAYKAATTALKKRDLTGTRAKVHLVLDRSASMRAYYKDGSAQALAEQTLALAAHLDPEATVHVTFFSTEVDGTADLTLADHENKIDEVHAGLGRMGRTTYHAAVEAVLAHHEESGGDPAAPVLVVFQTDGAPDAKTPATQSLADAAKSHPGVFFSFVAFGEHDNKAFDYLRKLKTGNTSFFHAGPVPRDLTDKELYEGVLATWRP